MISNVSVSLNNWWWRDAVRSVDCQAHPTPALISIREASGLTEGFVTARRQPTPGTVSHRAPSPPGIVSAARPRPPNPP